MITFYEDDDITVQGETNELHPNEVFIHCVVDNWSVTKYRKFLTIWSVILDELAEKGCIRVNSIIPKNDMRTRRFQTMFGLRPIQEVRDYVRYALEV